MKRDRHEAPPPVSVIRISIRLFIVQRVHGSSGVVSLAGVVAKTPLRSSSRDSQSNRRVPSASGASPYSALSFVVREDFLGWCPQQGGDYCFCRVDARLEPAVL